MIGPVLREISLGMGENLCRYKFFFAIRVALATFVNLLSWMRMLPDRIHPDPHFCFPSHGRKLSSSSMAAVTLTAEAPVSPQVVEVDS